MGGVAKVVGRVGAGILTGGLSETRIGKQNAFISSIGRAGAGVATGGLSEVSRAAESRKFKGQQSAAATLGVQEDENAAAVQQQADQSAENLPENQQRRATASQQSLGESGRRKKRASEFLAGAAY